MAQTINFGLVNLEANQYNPEVVYNQNLQKLDVTVQICATTITNTPPTATDGLIVIVGTSPTGAFATYNNKIAYYYNGWNFITPVVGWIATVSDTLSLIMWNGSSWSSPNISASFMETSFYVTKSGDATSKVKFNLSANPTSTTSSISIYGNVILAKQNFSATTDPSTSDDSYNISSIWVNNSTNKIFICVNNTSGNAVWKEMGGATGSGDVIGPITSIDNELVRFDGVTGETLQGSGIIITDNKQIYNSYAYIDTKTINYTLKALDSNKIVVVNSSLDVSITLPQTSNESINQGFNCMVIRRGTGNVTFLVEGTDTLESRNNGISIGNRYSSVTVLKLQAGTPNIWGLYGDVL